jgi:hypothetical protein
MPPQPLLSVRRDATLSVDPLALREHPALSLYIAEITATWAQIDCNLGVILARMLGAAARPSMAMYSALTGASAQRAALRAAAEASLLPAHLEVFKIILLLAKRLGNKRNQIVHGLWGASPQVPHALVLISQDAIVELHTQNSEYVASVSAGNPVSARESLVPLDLSRAFVYREQDLSELLDDITELYSNTRSFALMLIMDNSGDGVSCQLLCNAPLIRAELQKPKKQSPQDR